MYRSMSFPPAFFKRDTGILRDVHLCSFIRADVADPLDDELRRCREGGSVSVDDVDLASGNLAMERRRKIPAVDERGRRGQHRWCADYPAHAQRKRLIRSALV